MSRVVRRRLWIAVGAFAIGAVGLAIVGVVTGGGGVDLVRLAGGGGVAGLLVGLCFLGAIEDGEAQDESERRRQGRQGTASR